MRRGLTVLAFACALAFAGTASATPVKAINAQPGCPGTNCPTVLSKMQTAGSTWARVNIEWSHLETARGVYSMAEETSLTTMFTQIHQAGSHVLAVLYGTPAWALCDANGQNCTGCTKGTTCVPYDDGYFEEFAQKVATLWPATNTTDGINAAEIWNEPDTSTFWAGTAAQYGPMEAYGYVGIKNGSSSMTVVAGATAHFDYTWDQNALPYEQYNALGVHPYPTNPNANYNNPAQYLNGGPNNSLAGYRNLNCTYGLNGCSTPIWFTESGFISDAPNPQLTLSQMATGLTDQFNYLATSGCTGCSNVKLDAWFLAWWPSCTPPPAPCYAPQSLLAPNFSPNPAYTAFQNAP